MFQDSLTKKIAEAAAQIKTEPEIIKTNEKSVEGAVEKIMDEELKGNQHKIDVNKNNKVDAHDFKLLRAQKEKEKANSMKFGKNVKEQVKPEVEKSFPATGVTKHAPVKGVSYMPKDKEKEKANSMKYGRQVKEETEELEEATPTAQQVKQGIGIARDKRYAKGNVTGAVKAMDKVNKGIAQHPVVNKELRKQNEETEIDEAMFPGTKEYEKKFGQSPQQKLKKVGDTEKTAQGEMKKTAKGVMHTRRFTEMLDTYKEGGLKTISEMLVKEEPDNEEFTKEVEDQKSKMDGKKKGADIAKGSVQSVKNEEVEELDELSKETLGSYVNKASDSAAKSAAGSTSWAFRSTAAKNPRVKAAAEKYSDEDEAKKQKRLAGVSKAVNRLSKEETEIAVINADAANGVEMVDIAEREMTDAEMKKREDIVKGMKKGMAGFKQRYGDRAKQVMYATATKSAMKD
jgi:hypothetical protein